MLSIITASYNYEKYIRETIESVLAQRCPEWEMIIVDDGSKDNSVEIIKQYCEKDSRIKLFTHENNINKGLCETIKLGLSKCSGDYVAFLESDDKWESCAVENKLKAIKQNPNAAIIVNDIELIGDDEYVKKYSEVQKSYFQKQKELFLNGTFDIKEFLKNNYFPTFSCMTVKKDYLEKADFNSPSKPNLDWYLWVQILNMCREIIYIPNKDTLWRVHGNSYISARNRNDYEKFFGTLHEILYKKDISSNLYRISEFLHRQKIEKISRANVTKFDKFIIKKFPHKILVTIFSIQKNTNKPILSICIPTYNRGEYLYTMLSNFLKTKNNNFEIIVSDNKSTDGAVDKLKTIQDKRFRLIENENNYGSYINSLIAFSAANGEYIMPLMDKDFICSDKIDEVITLLQKEKFYVGYFNLDYDNEISFVDRFYSKTDCIKNLAYGTRHPSGFLFDANIFHQKNLCEKYKNAEDIVKTFMVDFLAAELCEYKKGAIFHIKFVKMAHPPFDGIKHSYTYSPDKGNLFFTPENRFKAFKSFFEHMNSLNLNENERVNIIVEMLKQLYHQSTSGYIYYLNDKGICDWYNISESFKNKVLQCNLEEDFKQKLNTFNNFKSKNEEKKVFKKFNQYIRKTKYKFFKKKILHKILTLKIDLAAKFFKKYFHKKEL
ncbi:MAG: glycosyltransferase family 2 protein [Candidatus Gastranaerophilaceae bacterium]